MSSSKLTKYTEQLGEPVICYDLVEIHKSATHVHALGTDYWLAIWENSGGGHHITEYAFFSFVCASDSSLTDARYARVWHGSGPAGSLREMRHTWFSPDESDPDMQGYVFYLPIDATIAALTILKKYFD